MIKRTRRRSRYEQRTSCDGPPSCSFLVLALAETYRDWLALEISSIGLDVVNCAKQFVRLVNLILSRRKWEGSVCLFVTHSATQWPTFQLYGATMSPFAIHNSRSTSSCVSGVCLFFCCPRQHSFLLLFSRSSIVTSTVRTKDSYWLILLACEETRNLTWHHKIIAFIV